jgi:hypothetical protein
MAAVSFLGGSSHPHRDFSQWAFYSHS